MPADMKSIIAETFMKMVSHKNIDKITVKSLIEECHISRQTFYYHFQDIMDVLEWSVRQQTHSLVKESLEAGDLRSAINIFITFCTEHFSEFQKLLNSQRRAQIEELLIDAAKAYMVEVSRHNHPDLYVNYCTDLLIFSNTATSLRGSSKCGIQRTEFCSSITCSKMPVNLCCHCIPFRFPCGQFAA